MKLQFTLNELSSLLVYLRLPLRLSRTVRAYMQNRALKFISSTRFEYSCKQICTQNSIEGCCLLKKHLQTSVTLPLSGTVAGTGYYKC